MLLGFFGATTAWQQLVLTCWSWSYTQKLQLQLQQRLLCKAGGRPVPSMSSQDRMGSPAYRGYCHVHFACSLSSCPHNNPTRCTEMRKQAQSRRQILQKCREHDRVHGGAAAGVLGRKICSWGQKTQSVQVVLRVEGSEGVR
jgi:hypothetical protein